jgi:membrane associated rhomboid family serine protease
MSRYAPSTTQIQFGPGPITPAVRAILIACAATFVLTLAWPAALYLLGVSPQAVIEEFALWQPLTYIFVHQGVMHLVFNMLGIWMFGVELERRWGTPEFTRFFLVCGVVAGLATITAGLLPFDAAWRARTYEGVTVGASGAFYGIAYAWARTFPHRSVLMFFVFQVQAKWFVIILIAMDFAVAASSGLSSNVAHLAHFAGLLTGYVYLNGGIGRGPGGLSAEVKYRYLRWKMNRLRKKFDVHEGGKKPPGPWVH